MNWSSLSPQLELDGKMGSLHLLLSPRQILHLLDLLSSLNLSGELWKGWL